MLYHVVLLRHALAGVRQDWIGDDQARPLDRAGLAQSLKLSDSVEGWPIDEIWTSPAVRCRHTVMELAAVRRLPVYDAPWLLADVDPDAVDAAVSKLAGSVLLCVHGESVDGLLSALTGHRPDVWLQALGVDDLGHRSDLDRGPDLDRGLDKGAAWHLRFDGETLVEAVLVPAPNVAPELAPVLPG